MPAITPYVTVTTTLDSESAARALAHSVVGERLAACAQALPIHSIYRWKGNVESAAEIRLTCKTTGERAAALVRFIKAHHSYEVPEIVVTPILDGLPAYLDWIRQETTGQTPGA